MTNHRLGPILLADGVQPRHAVSFIVVAIASIGLLVFLNFMQPYLLYGQVIAPPAWLGRITSLLGTMHEFIVLLCVGPLGALSDRTGRPVMFAAGLVIIALALAAYAMVGNLAELAAARALFACGAAATTATLAAVAADYPENSARGKFLGLLLITQQIAILVLVANGAARLPHLLVAHGMGKIAAGQCTFAIAAAFALASAGLAFRGLRRPMVSAGVRPSVFHGLGQIAAHARLHPRFLIVLLVAFVARGDASIMGAFLSLWAVKTATATGMTQTSAFALAGRLLSAVTICGIAAACAIGWLADRVDRLIPLTIALAVAGLGNAALMFIHDVTSWPVVVLVGVIAAGETAVIICGQTILGEQAPPALRGAATGMFGICGSLGVLILVNSGGFLFDKMSPQAPFIMLGVVNLLGCGGAFVAGKKDVLF
jgi:MFS family permease